MVSNLAQMEFVPVREGDASLSEGEIKELRPLTPDWKVVECDGARQLEREFKFKNFAQALKFTNQVGELAEEKDHHPSLLTEWGKVTVTWWTHKVNGLHRNDFFMAANTDKLYRKQ
jgi:4a-hydroxytetrahydrobiopterin dehydratase